MFEVLMSEESGNLVLLTVKNSWYCGKWQVWQFWSLNEANTDRKATCTKVTQVKYYPNEKILKGYLWNFVKGCTPN